MIQSWKVTLILQSKKLTAHGRVYRFTVCSTHSSNDYVAQSLAKHLGEDVDLAKYKMPVGEPSPKQEAPVSKTVSTSPSVQNKVTETLQEVVVNEATPIAEKAVKSLAVNLFSKVLICSYGSSTAKWRIANCSRNQAESAFLQHVANNLPVQMKKKEHIAKMGALLGPDSST